MDKHQNIPVKTRKTAVRHYRLPVSIFKSPARSIGALTSTLLTKTLEQRGFAGSEIIERWASIVGNSLAQISIPERLDWPRKKTTKHPVTSSHATEGGTLYIRVDGPASIEIQHMSDQILRRINNFFGFMAVSKLHIIQAPIRRPGPHVRKQQHISSPTKSDATMTEPSLEESLKRLAQAMHNRQKNTDSQNNLSEP